MKSLRLKGRKSHLLIKSTKTILPVMSGFYAGQGNWHMFWTMFAMNLFFGVFADATFWRAMDETEKETRKRMTMSSGISQGVTGSGDYAKANGF